MLLSTENIKVPPRTHEPEATPSVRDPSDDADVRFWEALGKRTDEKPARRHPPVGAPVGEMTPALGTGDDAAEDAPEIKEPPPGPPSTPCPSPVTYPPIYLSVSCTPKSDGGMIRRWASLQLAPSEPNRRHLLIQRRTRSE